MAKAAELDQASEALQRKLHPRRYPNASPKMIAIIGYILGIEVTRPSIESLVVTSDGMVLSEDSGQVGCNTIIGPYSELEDNWTRLLDCTTDLTAKERKEAEARFARKVRRV